MIKEHDRIVLTEPVPAAGFEAGDVGTVVHVYADGKAFEVEFTMLDGKTPAVATVEAAAIRPGQQPRNHAVSRADACQLIAAATTGYEFVPRRGGARVPLAGEFSSRGKFSGRNCSCARSKSANSRSWTHWIASLRWDDAKPCGASLPAPRPSTGPIDTRQPHLIVEQAGPRCTQPTPDRTCTMPKPVPLPPPGFDGLSVDERINCLQWQWDRITAGADTIPVPKWHRDIIDVGGVLRKA